MTAGQRPWTMVARRGHRRSGHRARCEVLGVLAVLLSALQVLGWPKYNQDLTLREVVLAGASFAWRRASAKKPREKACWSRVSAVPLALGPC